MLHKNFSEHVFLYLCQNDASNDSKDTSPVILSQQVSNLQKDVSRFTFA